MARHDNKLLDRLALKRVQRFWAQAQDRIAFLGPAALRRLRNQGRALSREVDQTVHLVDQRLTQSLAGTTAPRGPAGSEWAWRPDLWSLPARLSGLAGIANQTTIAPGTDLFHDCPTASLTLHQQRMTRPEDTAEFGVALDVLHFDGSFLSLAIDLPKNAGKDLRLRHLLRVEGRFEAERGGEVYVRLNVAHGPNTEQITRTLPATGGAVDFDLAYTKIDDTRVERAWIDLIFERPAMNRIVLRDLVLSRRPRADI